MNNQKIIIGARGSELSLKQADIIKNLLVQKFPHGIIEIKTITTKGDKNLKPIPLDTIGKGWFTKELDIALMNNTIDIAVHSLKDITEILPDQFTIAAIPEREDPRDVLVSKGNITLKDLKKNAIIGTDSVRRKIQILEKRRDLIVKSIRGNIPTRLIKLFEGKEYDALVLAAAGLKRLGSQQNIAEYFDAKEFIPAPGQGAIAVVIRKNDTNLFEMVKKINHQQSYLAAQAERNFSELTGGGCKIPVGSYAYCQDDKLTLYGMIGSIDGKQIVRSSVAGSTNDGKTLAQELANTLKKKKLVVITRPKNQSLSFKRKLEFLGANVYLFPCIKITRPNNASEIEQVITKLKSYDWFIFTSVNGVKFFINTLREYKQNLTFLKNKKISAVGLKTAEKLKLHNLPVHFIPGKFTTGHLGRELNNIKNKKILLANSSLSNDSLEKVLRKKAAIVTNIALYQTEFINEPDKTFEQLLLDNAIDCITFTSSSSVIGFVKRISNKKLLKKAFSLPVISIGPVTTQTAKNQGFKKIYTTDVHTVDGIIDKLKSLKY